MYYEWLQSSNIQAAVTQWASPQTETLFHMRAEHALPFTIFIIVGGMQQRVQLCQPWAVIPATEFTAVPQSPNI